MKTHFSRFLSLAVLGIGALVIYLSLTFFQPQNYFPQKFVFGRVEAVTDENLTADPYVPGRFLGRQELRVRILGGEHKDHSFDIVNTLTKGHNIRAEEGRRYVFSIRKDKDSPVVWLYNYHRAPYLYGLTGLFIILVILIAGRKGIRSLISLYFTGVMIIFVLVPLILSGADPIFVSILILSLITLVSFLLLTGLSRKTLTAFIGTVGGIVSAGFLSYATTKLASLSGIHMEKGEQILYIARDFNIRINGFLFASILIASLGAIMDVAMSLASSMEELKNHNPDMNPKKLFSSGMTIGRDMIGTMTNTLILAFTGGSFTLILMIYGLSMSYLQMINIPMIAIEIIQALSGSIGIVLTVPLTNITAIFLTKSKERKK